MGEPEKEEGLEKEVVEEAELKEPSEETGEETPSPGAEEAIPDMAELQRTISGLKKGISAERGKRQQLEGRIQTITSMLDMARERKKEETPAEKKVDRIPVSFDEEGNPYVAPEQLEGLTSRQLKAMEEKLARIEQSQGVNVQQSSVQRTIQSVVSEDTAYPASYSMLTRARTDLSQIASDYLQENDLQAPTTIDAFLDLIEEAGLDKVFMQKYPGVKPEIVAEAFVHPRKLRKALKALSSSEAKDTGGINPTLKALSGKPGTLAGKRNQGAKTSGLDKLADLSTDDFLNLSDAEVAQLKAQLRKESEL